tara:strand:- start:488 stop:658 length:171 start_codon:yes stop_codon:yes gene_type:complete
MFHRKALAVQLGMEISKTISGITGGVEKACRITKSQSAESSKRIHSLSEPIVCYAA